MPLGVVEAIASERHSGVRMEPVAALPKERKIWPVVRVASGNFFEMYDFQVFGYYAAAIDPGNES
jgi:hypothetical protein